MEFNNIKINVLYKFKTKKGEITIIGDIIRELRKDKNIDQKQLANFLNVSAGTISNYENEEYEPNLDTLNKIANYFNVSVDYLLGRVKFRFDYSVMSKNIKDKYTVSNLLNDILNLQNSDIMLVVDYVDLLKLRNNKKYK